MSSLHHGASSPPKSSVAMCTRRELMQATQEAQSSLQCVLHSQVSPCSMRAHIGPCWEPQSRCSDSSMPPELLILLATSLCQFLQESGFVTPELVPRALSQNLPHSSVIDHHATCDILLRLCSLSNCGRWLSIRYASDLTDPELAQCVPLDDAKLACYCCVQLLNTPSRYTDGSCSVDALCGA